MLNTYLKLVDFADQMVGTGTNALDPVVRSIYRKMEKLYKQMSKEDQQMADFRCVAELPFV